MKMEKPEPPNHDGLYAWKDYYDAMDEYIREQRRQKYHAEKPKYRNQATRLMNLEQEKELRRLNASEWENVLNYENLEDLLQAADYKKYELKGFVRAPVQFSDEKGKNIDRPYDAIVGIVYYECAEREAVVVLNSNSESGFLKNRLFVKKAGIGNIAPGGI